MKINNNHISYCTNIHSGQSWEDHFEQLKKYVPAIKNNVSPIEPFGLGLRLSADASKKLADPDNLHVFKTWLKENNVYVFTMNGFPYGDFHENTVKDKVHYPDWTTTDRRDYTKRLFSILTELTPEKGEAGISTVPLSYRFWLEEGTEEWKAMRKKATQHILEIAYFLHVKEQETGKLLHLDIEPEPDGVIETGEEFINWYQQELIPQAIRFLTKEYGLSESVATSVVHRHIRICYDVCHVALGYENHEQLIAKLEETEILIGKFQISSALKIDLTSSLDDRLRKKEVLQEFDEPIYLHQVIGKKKDGQLIRYKDLPEALPHIVDMEQEEWRSHFHVPIFLSSYGDLSSTQQDILDVLRLHQKESRTNHIEVETYTWGVLPKSLQMPIEDSLSRELIWLLNQLKN